VLLSAPTPNSRNIANAKLRLRRVLTVWNRSQRARHGGKRRYSMNVGCTALGNLAASLGYEGVRPILVPVRRPSYGESLYQTFFHCAVPHSKKQIFMHASKMLCWARSVI
jgi:hypothetical protein